MRAWIAKRERFHLHFTPTYASWLNQVGRWLSMLSQRASKRSTLRSVTDPRQRIIAFTEQYNKTAKPFAWVATADSIFEKLERLCSRITGTPHWIHA